MSDPKPFAPEIEEVWKVFVAFLKEVGHPIPDTPARVHLAKNELRKMHVIDKVPYAEMIPAIAWIEQNHGDDTTRPGRRRWFGWRVNIRCAATFRHQYTKQLKVTIAAEKQAMKGRGTSSASAEPPIEFNMPMHEETP